MKVLLIGHSISPIRGSEPGLSWNWAWYLSRDHQIWVISHTEFTAEVDDFLAQHPNPNLHIVRLKGSDWDPAKGQAGVRLHYLKWLRKAEVLARQLHSQIAFDLVHHVSFSSVSAPPKLWQLGIPFVWGPLGGAQTCPLEMLDLFGSEKFMERIRTLRVRLLPFFPALRKTVRKAAVLLATNFETQRALQAAGAKDVMLFWDNGVADDSIPTEPLPRGTNAIVRVLWASKMEKRKALPLALMAMSCLKHCSGLELVIAGDGPERNHWMKLSASMDFGSRVRFLGNLQPAEMRQQFLSADIFLFTSIRDSCASVVLEAMLHALPVVTLDIHGVGGYMPDDAGIKVRIDTVQSVATALAAAIQKLAEDPQLRQRQGIAGWQYAKEQQWSKRAERMSAIYQNCSAETTDNAGERGTLVKNLDVATRHEERA